MHAPKRGFDISLQPSLWNNQPGICSDSTVPGLVLIGRRSPLAWRMYARGVSVISNPGEESTAQPDRLTSELIMTSPENVAAAFYRYIDATNWAPSRHLPRTSVVRGATTDTCSDTFLTARMHTVCRVGSAEQATGCRPSSGARLSALLAQAISYSPAKHHC